MTLIIAFKGFSLAYQLFLLTMSAVFIGVLFYGAHYYNSSRAKILLTIRQEHQYIVTLSGIVVTYQNIVETFEWDHINQKLADILRSHPTADLMKYQEPLGIKILFIEKSTQNRSDDNIYV